MRHETAAELRARSERESAVRPKGALPNAAPARLSGHPTAEAVWRRLMRLYAELEGELVTKLDMDLLVDYCVLIEQTDELDEMRGSARDVWRALMEARQAARDEGDDASALSLGNKVTAAFDAIVKLDGRVDRKRALLLQLRQSLYLTPRARAGVAPDKKEEPAPPDEMESLLAEANEIIYGKEQTD